VVKLPKIDRFDFEKIKSKNFKKRPDLRQRAACGGWKWTIRGGGEANKAVGPWFIAMGGG
jgi:hypothetical protein